MSKKETGNRYHDHRFIKHPPQMTYGKKKSGPTIIGGRGSPMSDPAFRKKYMARKRMLAEGKNYTKRGRFIH
jgi:hypothetical protein